MKYFADLHDSYFEIKDIETHDTIYSVTFSEAGITENDPEYTCKMDDYLETVLNISPDEWEVG